MRRESSADNDNRFNRGTGSLLDNDLRGSGPGEDFDIFGSSNLAKRNSSNQV
jgi:hypothetical protein